MSILISILSKLAHDNSGSLKSLHKKVKNWHEVMLLLAGTKNVLEIKLRNGKHYSMKVTDRYVLTNYKGKGLRFCYGTKEERIHAILMTIGEFLDEPHSKLYVKGRNVIDIGAYIGDTPIYFAFNGAKHVYALEPYPYSYKLAKRNIRANGLVSKITLINAACGSKRGNIKIEENYKNLAGSEVKASRIGKHIPVLPLDNLVKKYAIKDASLKVDCEGCEYDIILKSKAEVLRKFKSVLIEYHYGYETLEKRLKEVGFKVTHTKPEIMRNANVANKNMIGGTIFAELVNQRTRPKR